MRDYLCRKLEIICISKGWRIPALFLEEIWVGLLTPLLFVLHLHLCTSFINPGIPTPDNEPVWKCVCTLSGYHGRDVYDISWSSSGLIATAGGDNAIRIFKQVQHCLCLELLFNYK